MLCRKNHGHENDLAKITAGPAGSAIPTLCRSADRSSHSPTSHSRFVGFRVVRRIDQ
jgi:formylglycine-generating enzyme required for sulfatase activity